MTTRCGTHGTSVGATAWTAALCTALLLASPSTGADASRHAREQRALEAARYLFEIEGERTRALEVLEPLSESPDPVIRARVSHLRGRFLEEQGFPDEAAGHYAAALSGPGLSAAQRAGTVKRLLVLDPGALRPFESAGTMNGLPARVFAIGGDDGYILTETPAGTGRPPPRVLLQDAKGELHPVNAALDPDEEILDATGDRLLTRGESRRTVRLRRAPAYIPVTVQERFPVENGHLFRGDAGELLLIGTQELRFVRDGRVLFSHPLPGPGCAWHPAAARARKGVVFCPGRALFRADFAARTVTRLPLEGEPPAEVALSGDYLALRYPEHVEIRRGPAFETFLWGFPAGLQEPIALGDSHVFAADGEGSLRALHLRTGRVDWRRETGVSALQAHGEEVMALTHARTLAAFDGREGRRLFEYETGWENETPLLLPSPGWIVLQWPDGRRVRLNRELLRHAGIDRDYLFHGVREALRARDTAAALTRLDALLALEPGNGAAWREKARLLEALQAPRAERTRAWMQTSRSRSAAPWSTDTAFARLAGELGASWVWKRQPGPRFFPLPAAGNRFSFYVENDNRTLVVLDNRTGSYRGSHRFEEPLDLKVSAWIGDTLIVSGSNRLYLMPPPKSGEEPARVELQHSLCHALTVPGGFLFSDWNGNLYLLDPSTQKILWQTSLARGGLLLAAGGETGTVDVFEIDGGYHRVRLEDGEPLASLQLPPGTVTEVHAGPGFAFAGYNEGLIVAVDKRTETVSWQRNMGEQIFSLAGRGDETLLIGTATQRFLNIEGRTGTVRAQARVPTYLFNRPLLTADGYWVGTTEPALEKRSMNHEVLRKLPLTAMPGTPAAVGSGIAVSTLDNFILHFPVR